MIEELSRLAERVKAAEEMGAAGSYEQEQYVKAALYSVWPRLRAAIQTIVADKR